MSKKKKGDNFYIGYNQKREYAERRNDMLTDNKEDKLLKFKELAEPLIKFLCDNFNPHTKIIIEPTSAEIVSGEMVINTEEFLTD